MTEERVCANSPTMSRRTLLTALPVAGAVGAVPALAGAPDPILAHYKEWCSARKEWHRLGNLPGNGDFDSPESIEAAAREDAALKAMTNLTPTSQEGIAAITHAIWDVFGTQLVPSHPEYSEQCDWPGNKLIRAIWRATSGQSGIPGQG